MGIFEGRPTTEPPPQAGLHPLARGCARRSSKHSMLRGSKRIALGARPAPAREAEQAGEDDPVFFSPFRGVLGERSE
jgi:hypothetical protein